MAKRKVVPVTQIELTIGDAVSTGFSMLEELGGEMREVFDNMPESLQTSPVGEARNEAADALENISEPTVPDNLTELKFQYLEFRHKRYVSRSARRDEAVSYLEQVKSFLEELDSSSEDADKA